MCLKSELTLVNLSDDLLMILVWDQSTAGISARQSFFHIDWWKFVQN